MIKEGIVDILKKAGYRIDELRLAEVYDPIAWYVRATKDGYEIVIREREKE